MQGVDAEKISALMDGELDSADAAREIARFKQPGVRDAARHVAWNTYHAIGDALRGEPAVSQAFATRLAERLAQEPTVLAPRVRWPRAVQPYALSAAASVAAVAVVGWVALNVLNADVAPGTLAQAPAGKAAEVAPSTSASPSRVEPVALAPEHVHEYLLAHQGISPTTAIQGVTPYIRTVSNTGGDGPALR